jgi:hypothetical protein
MPAAYVGISAVYHPEHTNTRTSLTEDNGQGDDHEVEETQALPQYGPLFHLLEAQKIRQCACVESGAFAFKTISHRRLL